ncbi:MAG: FAD binding domain-containing protein [Sphaerochaeta sp.]|jgi:putative selenate reductase FAD-binding subunit
MIQEFLVASNISDALSLRRNTPKSRWFAGGTEINRLNSGLDAKAVVSLSKLGLDTIIDEGPTIRIGAMVSLQQLIDSPLIPAWLKQAAAYCGSYTRRHMATIGGNLALMSDHSYLAPALLASRCTLKTANLTEGGAYSEDEIPVREYHAYIKEHANTLILSIALPKDKRYVGSRRFALSVQNRSAVNVAFGAMMGEGLVISHVRLFAAVHGSGLQRLNDVENAIEAGELSTREDVQLAVSQALEATDDFIGSAQYKRYIAAEGIGQLFSEFLKGGV